MYKILYLQKARKDLKKIKLSKLNNRADELIEIIKEGPLKTPPAFELLCGELTGYVSRRINYKHRLVYRVIPGDFVDADGRKFEGKVEIIKMWTHYDGLASMFLF